MINIHVFDNQMDTVFKRIQGEIDAAINKEFKARVKEMFVFLVDHTPQWSGNYASNWWITTDPHASYYNRTSLKGNVEEYGAGWAGLHRGVDRPKRLMNLARFDYKKPVYFVNNTPTLFDEDTNEVVGYDQPYKGAHYPSITKVRPENLFDGKVFLENALKRKYG